MILQFIVWDVSPPEMFAFPDWLPPLIGGRGVRWYGALFAASFVIGYYIMEKVLKRDNMGIKVLDELSTYMLIATVIGARLGHCLFYEPAYYLANPIEILKVWEGGLASHGAAVGIIIALYFSPETSQTLIWTLDRVVIVVALAGFLIRMGNLMNSEIFGHITSLLGGAFSLCVRLIRHYAPIHAIPHKFTKHLFIWPLSSFCTAAFSNRI